jgi:hypothetical protein
VTYTAIAVAFLIICVALGTRSDDRARRLKTAVVAATIMVIAQFVLLISQ